MTLAEILDELFRCNIHIAVENGDLRVRAPKGALTEALRRFLKERKPELIEYFSTPGTKRKTAPAKSRFDLDCLVVGHYDQGFAAHEQNLRSGGIHSGQYRNLEMDWITLDGQKRSYAETLAYLTGQPLHWTEMPQVACIYLTHFLNARGFNADFCGFFPGHRNELESLIRRAKTVAVTTTLYLTPIPAMKAIAFIRNLNSDAHIVVGGPLIVNMRDHLRDDDFYYVLDSIGADTYIWERQGEQTLANLLACLNSTADVSAVKNCFIRQNSKWIYTGAEPEDNDLNQNVINWNIFEHKKLGPIIQTRSTRGCPFHCAFCEYPIRGGKWTMESLENIEKEIKQLRVRQDKVQYFVSVDDTFNIPLERCKDILRMMIRNQFGFQWFSYFRPGLADAEMVALMKASGCSGVFMGLESGDPVVLKNMNKGATPEQYQRGVKLLNEADIMLFASLIVGFPGETETSVRRTIDLINDIRPTFFRVGLWYYDHSTPIHQEKDRYRLEGSGYNWKHATMDWSVACDLVETMFREVKESVWLPLYDFDFWIFPYLMGKGMSLDHIRTYVTLCNQLLLFKLDSAGPDESSGVEAQLRRFCKNLNFYHRSAT
jgi:radical SAM PhpK family P-methyltransferase